MIAFSAVILGVHNALMQQQPNTMTIIVPRHPQEGREIAKVSFSSHILSKHDFGFLQVSFIGGHPYLRQSLILLGNHFNKVYIRKRQRGN